MNEISMNLRFKGSRDYVHGTDMFNATLACIEDKFSGAEITDVDFSIHRIARSQLALSFGAPPAGVEAVAQCAFNVMGQRQRVYLSETASAIVSRYPYPEDEIVQCMEVDLPNRTAVLNERMPYGEIEISVAMIKALHQKVFHNLPGKWMFVRARFPNACDKTSIEQRMIRIASSFNDKLTRNEIHVNGAKVGEIYFSIV